MTVFRRSGAVSRIALAIVLSSGVALTVAAPAQAAKKQETPAGPKTNYSKAFVAVYPDLAKKVEAGGDLAPVKGEVLAAQSAAQSPDDKYAIGRLIYKVGAGMKDIALQRQGVGLMVDSGSVLLGSEKSSLQYAAAQLAYQEKDWAAARTLADKAVAGGYVGDADLLVAETYFAEDQSAAGIDRLDKAIAKKVAANQPVPEDWLKRGFAKAVQAKLFDQGSRIATMYAQYYPSQTTWSNAIAMQRNLNNYDGQELLDLLRLSQRTNALSTERDYADYISAVDARRLPGETQRIIKAGVAAGLLRSNDVFVSEASATSSARVAADTADLPKLARDARAPGASVATLMAAGDAFLSYQKAADAEEFYTLALAKPGVDTARVLTRLGIAQVDQGKLSEAQANFAKVQGARQPIAQLWSVYAAQAAKPTA